MSHYISNTVPDREAMLKAIGVESVERLFDVVPADVRFPELHLPKPLSEAQLLRELRAMSGAMPTPWRRCASLARAPITISCQAR